MTKTYVKTSEAVSIGHPDKICDQVSDAIFDHLRQFKDDAQSAVEVAAGANTLLIFGEIDKDVALPVGGDVRVASCNPQLTQEIGDIAARTIREIGYAPGDYSPNIIIDLVTQSPEINGAVEATDSREAAAGDQGIVTGFAVAETASGHALHFILAHEIMKALEEDRRSGTLPWLLPDAKSQVTVKYVYSEYALDRAIAIDNILVSQSHSAGVHLEEVREIIKQRILEIVKDFLVANGEYLEVETLLNSLDNTEFFINPAGAWHFGGPRVDSGLTGRKLVVDNYGSAAPIGGGATSGKNFNKVDRSGAYYARNIAKSIVFSGLADKCLVELGFAIGVSSAISVNIETFGTEKIELDKIYKLVHENYDFRVTSMIALASGVSNALDASRHGNYTDSDFPWEKTVSLSS